MKQIFELIEHNLRAGRGDAVAATIAKVSYTYADLAGLVEGAAHYFSEHVGKGERVALVADKSIDFLVYLFACTKIGAVFVPVNPKLKPAQAQYILDHAGVTAAFATPIYLKRNGFADGMGEGITMLPKVADIEPAQGTVDVSVIDIDLAAILYTSGSTGQPKGVMISHRNILSGAECVGTYLGLSSDDHVLCVLSFSFDAGLSQIFSSFWAGARAVFLEFAMPDQVRVMTRDEGITVITAIPTLWRQILAADWQGDDAATVRKLANTGGHLDTALQARLDAAFGDPEIYLMYGLTEAFRSAYLDPKLRREMPNSIGKAVPNAELLLIKEDGTEAGPGEQGELVHRGAHVALGYWNDVEKTNKVYRPIPARGVEYPREEIGVWSGDVMTKDADGFLYFVGRNDGMIKRSGYRISATEVETGVAEALPKVEAVVFGRKDADLDHEICLILEVAEFDADAWRDLSKSLRQILPQHMVPTSVTWVAEFPKTANGKVDRTVLVKSCEDADWLS